MLSFNLHLSPNNNHDNELYCQKKNMCDVFTAQQPHVEKCQLAVIKLEPTYETD